MGEGTVKTGITEAMEWLAENHPTLHLSHSVSKLVPGERVGDPTRLACTVTIAPKPTAIERDGLVFEDDAGWWLTGEGPTILDAIKVAVGNLP